MKKKTNKQRNPHKQNKTNKKTQRKINQEKKPINKQKQK
jgi:hypothetical protein